MRNKINKIIMTMSLVFCMAVSIFAIDVSAAEVDYEKPIDSCETVMEAYTAKEAEKYIAGENTYPKKDGYLFAGWYTTDSLPTEDEKAAEFAIDTTVPEGQEQVYALFVPEHVLSIKAQISATMLDEKTNNDDTASIRFVTTVNSLLYKQVGFEITYIGSDGKLKTGTSASNKVYEKLYVAGTTDEWQYTPQGTFCGASQYFKACTVTDVPKDNYNTEFTVKPYWITLNGDKVYGETAVKTIAEGCIRKEAWISTDANVAKDEINYGGYANPYATLEYALTQIKDGGTIYVKDDFTYAADYAWTAHGKNVIITGSNTQTDIDNDDSVEALDFSAISDLCINDGVTFTNIKLTFSTEHQTRIFAEGHKLKISSDVTFTNESAAVQVLGGSKTSSVASTNLELYAGTYTAIFGGSATKDVLGDTKVIVGGNVNSGINATEHLKSHILFGAGWAGTVHGDTNIEVQSGAKFTYVFGGGDDAAAVVKGSTNIKFAGEAMSIYGGSVSGSNGDTHVVMTDGYVEQIFGGSENASMTGDTDVRILGGTVVRRIFGGCYNESSNSGNKVTGHANVLIGPNANITFSYGFDDVIRAISRYGSFEGECGTFIFNDQSKYIADMGDSGYGSPEYHYRVTTNGNTTGNVEDDLYGSVLPAGDCLHIIPKENYVATVTIGDVVKHYTEGESYYPLPKLSSTTSQTDIVVTFNETVATDFVTNAKAKIATGSGYAYFETLTQAIVVAEKMDNATIETTEALTSITVKDSKNGTVTSSCKNCVPGTTVTLTVTPDEGYNLTSLSVTKDGTAVDVGEVTFAGGTYSINAEDGDYIVEAEFTRKIFDDSTEWDESGQYNGKLTIPSSDGDSDWVCSTDSNYGDTDLKFTVRDYNRSSSQFRFAVGMQFENEEYVIFSIVRTSKGAYVLQTMNDSIFGWYNPEYTITTEQEENIKGEKGLEFRIVRVGDTVDIFLDGVHAWEADLSVKADGTSSGVADLTSNIQVRCYGNNGNTVEVPFSISDAPEMGTITINDTENGTVTASTKKYCVGDEVTITITPDDKYDCTSFMVDGKEVELSNGMSGTYTFTATDISHEVNAEFTRKIFDDSKDWDESGQYDGYLTIPSSDGDSDWIYSTDNNYGDTDLRFTVRNYNPSSSNFRFAVKLQFENDENVTFSIVKTSTGAYVLQTMGGTILNWVNSDYTITTEQTTNITSKEGLEFRIVRVGDTADIYLDGIHAWEVDLSEKSDGTSSGVADLTSDIEIRCYGNTGYKVEIPFSISDAPEMGTITINETENGTVTASTKEYSIGDEVTITVTPDDKYDCTSCIVDGKEVALSNGTSGTYTFTTTHISYKVDAEFTRKIFNDSKDWDESGQYDGYLTIPSSDGDSDWVYSTDNNYGDTDLKFTVRDYNRSSSQFRFAVGMQFENGEYVIFSIVRTKAGGYVLQTMNDSIFGWYNPEYTITTEQQDNIKGEKGLEFRIVRVGDTADIYLDGVHAWEADLSVKTDGTSSGVKNLKSNIQVRCYGNNGYTVEVPFIISAAPAMEDEQ